MTDGVAVFKDGERRAFSLSFEDFKKMFREGQLDGRPLREIEILSKHSDKGPNRIRFE